MMIETLHLASRGGANGGPRIFFPLLMLLLAGLLLGKVMRRRKYGMSHSGGGSAMRTLQDRFARGEIDQAEYDHRKAVLDGADAVPPAPPSSAPVADPMDAEVSNAAEEEE